MDSVKSGKRTSNQEDIRNAETCDLPSKSKTRKLLGHVEVQFIIISCIRVSTSDKMSLSFCNGFSELATTSSISSGLLFCVKLWFTLLVIAGPANACLFPDFAQTSVNGVDNARDWKGKIKNQYKDQTVQ